MLWSNFSELSPKWLGRDYIGIGANMYIGRWMMMMMVAQKCRSKAATQAGRSCLVLTQLMDGERAEWRGGRRKEINI